MIENAEDSNGTAEPRSLEDVIRGRLLDFDPTPLRPLIDRILAMGPDRVASIVLYGSRLSEITARPTSVHDFFALVDDYERFYSRARDRWLARVLPPNVYRYRLRLEDAADGPCECKVCVLSVHDLFTHTSPRARDFYILGRFSKRMALVWSRDAEATENLVSGVRSAAEALVPHALALMKASFTLEEFARQFLVMSYLGEVRPEGEEKVNGIFEAERPYYLALCRMLLADHVRANRQDFKVGDPPDVWTFRGTLRERSGIRSETHRRIARSRRRSVMRWPKQIYLFDNWFDFLLEKTERAWGVDLRAQLTERERRHPLLFGWKQFFRLRRQGKIR